MSQKPIGGIEFEVDSQIRVNSGPLATEAKQDAIATALEGVLTAQASTGPTVGASSGAVLAANANRVYASFVNDSNEDIYLAFGEAAVLHKGVPVKASGGSYEITRANLFRGAVNGICASGGKVLCVTEGM